MLFASYEENHSDGIAFLINAINMTLEYRKRRIPLELYPYLGKSHKYRLMIATDTRGRGGRTTTIGPKPLIH